MNRRGFLGLAAAVPATHLLSDRAPRAKAAQPVATQESTRYLDPTVDALHRRTITWLKDYCAWLDRGNVRGYIGEVGWPGADERWGHVAECFYAEAAKHNLLVTGWVADSWYGPGGDLNFYNGRFRKALDTPRPQAAVVERQTDRLLRGMNIGLDSPQEEYDYLASVGITYGRVQITWEQIQPELYKDVDYNYLARLKQCVARAGQAGIRVIVNLHNYGRYRDEPVSRNGTVQAGHLWDCWSRLSYHFKDNPHVFAYDIMNEPHDIPRDVWEEACRRAASAIRERGDNKVVMIPGLGWSAMHEYSRLHPAGPWVPDSNVWYTAHAYWHLDSGPDSNYDQQVAKVVAEGF